MKKVVIYTRASCKYCKMTKSFLKRKRIKYEEHNASRPAGFLKILIKTKQIGVPVLEINGQIIVGFDKKSIQKALKK